jgi:predicted transcriptional regulator
MELPKFLDLLLILNDETNTKILKHKLQKNKDYVFAGLAYLKEKNMIELKHSGKQYVIILTSKGKDAQQIVIHLFNKFK